MWARDEDTFCSRWQDDCSTIPLSQVCIDVIRSRTFEYAVPSNPLVCSDVLRHCLGENSWIQKATVATTSLQNLHSPQSRAGLVSGLVSTRSILQTRGAVPGMVKELDPDSVLRGENTIAVDDVARQEYIGRSMWKSVRAGGIKQALQTALSSDEKWRGLSLNGAGPGKLTAAGVPGNYRRHSWKKSARALAMSSKCNIWERAVYGFLSDQPIQAEKVCSNIEDLVFVHLNSLIGVHLDNLLVDWYTRNDYGILIRNFDLHVPEGPLPSLEQTFLSIAGGLGRLGISGQAALPRDCPGALMHIIEESYGTYLEQAYKLYERDQVKQCQSFALAAWIFTYVVMFCPSRNISVQILNHGRLLVSVYMKHLISTQNQELLEFFVMFCDENVQVEYLVYILQSFIDPIQVGKHLQELETQFSAFKYVFPTERVLDRLLSAQVELYKKTSETTICFSVILDYFHSVLQDGVSTSDAAVHQLSKLFLYQLQTKQFLHGYKLCSRLHFQPHSSLLLESYKTVFLVYGSFWDLKEAFVNPIHEMIEPGILVNFASDRCHTSAFEALDSFYEIAADVDFPVEIRQRLFEILSFVLDVCLITGNYLQGSRVSVFVARTKMYENMDDTQVESIIQKCTKLHLLYTQSKAN